MRLSTVVELLLILLLVAFAAWARVIDPKSTAKNTTTLTLSTNGISLKQATDTVNRYCICNDVICNCCRDFHIPLVQLKGPGCASLQYLKGDNLAVQLSFGDNILTSTIVNGKTPKPVCVPLLGGFSKFCGRIYSIEREENEHFKACLGLELQSTTELEASLRVSCFRFGPDGLKLRPSEPLPIVEDEIQSEEEDDDDDDDFLGLGTDDDDDDDDDDESIPPSPTSILNESIPQTNTKDEDDDDDEDEDAFGFQSLIDIFTGDEESSNKKPRPSTSTKPPLLHFTIPMLTRPSDYPLPSVHDNHPETVNEDELVEKQTTPSITEQYVTTTILPNVEDLSGEASNKVAQVDRLTHNKLTVLVKKKPTITSTSVNAINDEVKDKPKPITHNDEDEDDDEEEEEDEPEEENVEENYEEEEEDDDDDDDDDDDEDEAEAEVISELVADENGQAKKNNKVKKEDDDDDDDEDYDLDIDDILARKTQQRIHKA